MKKGARRKTHKLRNRARRGYLVAPQGMKSKKLRKNPPWGAMDQKALRKMANQVIGTTLMNALNIDFIGIMEQVEKEQRDKPITETIQ